MLPGTSSSTASTVDDAAYILSILTGIHEPTPLFPNSSTTAQQILALYDKLAANA